MFFFRFIPEKYIGLAGLETYDMNMLDFAVTLAVPVFCIFFSKTDDGKKYSSFISLMIIFACINVAFTGFSLSNNQFGRMAFYFANSYAVLIPFALDSFRKEDKQALSIIICLLCAMYFFIGNYEGTFKIDNYRFFWSD